MPDEDLQSPTPSQLRSHQHILIGSLLAAAAGIAILLTAKAKAKAAPG